MTVPSVAVIRPTAATRRFILGWVCAHFVRFFAMISVAGPCVIMRFGGAASAASRCGSVAVVWQPTSTASPISVHVLMVFPLCECDRFLTGRRQSLVDGSGGWQMRHHRVEVIREAAQSVVAAVDHEAAAPA